MAPNSNRSTARMGAVVNPCGQGTEALSGATAGLGLALALALAGCASSPEPRARVADRPDVPERCLAEPRAHADLAPGRPRSFLAAHEAFSEGQSAQAAGDMEAARAAFERAVTADPTHGLARIALAEAHWRTDNDAEAIRAHLAAAVLLLPENPRAHLRFADASAELGDLDAAVTHWRCALTLKPGLPAAHVALARHLLGAENPEEAEAHVRAALAEEPSDYRHHVLLAQALEGQARLDAAAAATARAAELVGRSAPLYRRAASLFDRAGAPERADRMRALADEIDPPRERRDLRPLRKARRKRGRRRGR